MAVSKPRDASKAPAPDSPNGLPPAVLALLNRRLSAERQKFDRTLVDRQFELSEKLREHIQGYLLDADQKPGRWKIFKMVLTQANQVATQVTEEWAKIVWRTIFQTLDEKGIKPASAKDCRGLLDRHLWAASKGPFTLEIARAEQWQRTMDRELANYGLPPCESEEHFARRRSVESGAIEVHLRERARLARNDVEIALDRYLLSPSIPRPDGSSTHGNSDDIARLRADERSDAARHAANAKHSAPGGSRDKRQQILEAWLTGKYMSRNQCAEKLAPKLRMSTRTARDALIGAPEPPKRGT